MKTAYELAMERLSKSSPTTSLSKEQKKQIAELESKCAAKIAERELAINEDIQKAVNAGQFEEIEKLQKQLVSDRQSFRADLEEKKVKVRAGKKG